MLTSVVYVFICLVLTGTEGACASRQISHSILHVNRLRKSVEEIPCSESDQASLSWSKSFKRVVFLQQTHV